MNNALLATYFGKKETFWKQKLKKLQEQKVRRKRRSVCYKKGRRNKWWENMLMGVFYQKTSGRKISECREKHFKTMFKNSVLGYHLNQTHQTIVLFLLIKTSLLYYIT